MVKDVRITALYCHSVNAIDTRYVATDHIGDVLSVVGAISMVTHVLGAVALYVCRMYLQTITTVLFLALVRSLSTTCLQEDSKARHGDVTALFSKEVPISVPGKHDRDHPSQGHAVHRVKQGAQLPCEMQARKRSRRDVGGGEDRVHPKRGQGRSTKCNDVGQCGPCVMRLHTDLIEQYQRSTTMRHSTSLEQAAKLSLYASTNTLSVRRVAIGII